METAFPCQDHYLVPNAREQSSLRRGTAQLDFQRQSQRLMVFGLVRVIGRRLICPQISSLSESNGYRDAVPVIDFGPLQFQGSSNTLQRSRGFPLAKFRGTEPEECRDVHLFACKK